jgi:flagellar biosynthesis/type III secretory pathway protein FliH
MSDLPTLPVLAGTPQAPSVAYLVSMLALAFGTMAAVVIVVVMRPTQDNTSIIATIVGITAPMMFALVAGAQQALHVATNSRLSELIAATTAAATAQGHADGMAEGRIAGALSGRALGTAEGTAAGNVDGRAASIREADARKD